MNALSDTWNAENWQQLGDIARRLVEEKARQRANAPGMTAKTTENGDDQQ